MLKISRGGLAVIGGLFLGTYVATVTAEQPSASAAQVRSFAGIWKAPEYKVAANTELDQQVWGKGASKVRNVQLAIEPSGQGVLRVNQSVVDPRGRVRPYSASVVEARIQIDSPVISADAARVEPTVKVLSAEERYLDGTNERRTIEGLKVSLSMPAGYSNIVNVRYDTAEGTGSFGETLTLQGRAANRRASASAAQEAARPSSRS
jgi:hypothetical protein